MSDELENGNVPDNTPQVSEIEQKALEMGWRPKEEWQGDEEGFVDAKEFVNRQPLYDKIHRQNQEIKTIHRTLDAFKKHFTSVEEASYKRALADLKISRKEALSDGDGDRFEKLDTEIKNVEAQMTQLQAEALRPAIEETPQEHPEFASWKARNRWYDSTDYMKAYADKIGSNLASRGMAPAEVLKEVEAAVRKEFPTKFSNPNKELAPNVNSGSARQRGTDSFEASLDPQERRIMETLVRSGIDKKEYLAQLKQIKNIK